MLVEPVADLTCVGKGHNFWFSQKGSIRTNICVCNAMFTGTARVISKK